jgi:hypothetical protein
MTSNPLRAADGLPGKNMKPGEQMVIPLGKFPGVTLIIRRTNRPYEHDIADGLNEIRTSGAHQWVVTGKGEVVLVNVDDGWTGPNWQPTEAEIAATHEVCGRYARGNITVEQFKDLNRRGQIAREVQDLLRQRVAA